MPSLFHLNKETTNGAMNDDAHATAQYRRFEGLLQNLLTSKQHPSGDKTALQTELLEQLKWGALQQQQDLAYIRMLCKQYALTDPIIEQITKNFQHAQNTISLLDISPTFTFKP
jgi:hypothetical protein